MPVSADGYLLCSSCGCDLGVSADDPYADPDCTCCDSRSHYGDLLSMYADVREAGEEIGLPPSEPICPTIQAKTRCKLDVRIIDLVEEALNAGVDQRDIALTLATAIDTAQRHIDCAKEQPDVCGICGRACGGWHPNA